MTQLARPPRIRPTLSSLRERLARLATSTHRRPENGKPAITLETVSAILHAQQEVTADGLLVVDPAGRVLAHNRRFLEIWQMPEEMGGAPDRFRMFAHARDLVSDPREFAAEVEALYENPGETRTDETIPLKDGRILSHSSVPVLSRRGEVIGRAWYFRDVTDQIRQETLKSALFRISEVAHAASDLDDLYRSIHRIVGELMDATNFYIALYDEDSDTLSFNYFVDEVDPRPEPQSSGKGLTWYVLRTGRALLATPAKFNEMVRRGDVESIGAPSVDWLGVPLLSGGQVIGVLGVQSYTEGVRYSEKDRDILVFVSQHVASAIAHKKKEHALRRAKEHSESLIKAANALIVHLDALGKVVMVNEMTERITGYSSQELRGQQWLDLLVSPHRHPRSGEMPPRRQRTLPRNLEFTITTAHGQDRQISWYNNDVHEAGKLVGTVCIGIDVTERRKGEEALRESETRYRQMFENNSAIKLLLDPGSGRIVDANPAACEFYGYTYDQITRRYIWDINILSENEIRYEMARAAAQRRNIFSFRHRTSSGEIRDVEIHSGPIHVHGQTLLYSIISDVTDRKRAEEAVQESEQKYRNIVNFASVGIIQVTAEGKILTANRTLAHLLGYDTVQELQKMNFADDISAENNEGGEIFRVFEDDLRGDLEMRWNRKDGSDVWVHVNGHTVRDRSGETLYYEAFVHDITERKRADEVLRDQATAFEASMDGMALLDQDGRFTYLNESHARLYGYSSTGQLLGQHWSVLYDQREAARFEHEVLPSLFKEGHWRGEAVGLRRDGHLFPQEVSLTTLGNGGMVCVVRDITERSLAEEQIRHLAYHDVLTALPNRLLFKDRLTVALSRAQREQTEVAVLFLDLDNFKKINDSLGHNIGDHLLQEVSARLQGCVRATDTVARLGGDEFIVLLPMLVHAEDAALIARKILEAMRRPFEVDGREMFITTSIGISVFPEDGRDAETLIKNADTAMYQAKEYGRDNYQIFNAVISANALERLALENGLRKAVEAHELRLYYQPIFDLRTGLIDGMEALVRWEHPHLGLVSPAEFIPLAEASGQMNHIGSWVFQTACEQLRAWNAKGFENLTVAVNLSISQLQHPDLVHTVMQILREAKVENGSVELEITESGAMQKPETTIRSLLELKRLGVRISLDDFGIGHSSLAYLKRFPIDTLKIDQSFVRDISTDPDTAAIVTAIIAMARTLKLKLIAEGVENEDQRSFLLSYGCHHMQGFLFQRPVPADEFEKLLHKNRQSPMRRSRFSLH